MAYNSDSEITYTALLLMYKTKVCLPLDLSDRVLSFLRSKENTDCASNGYYDILKHKYLNLGVSDEDCNCLRTDFLHSFLTENHEFCNLIIKCLKFNKSGICNVRMLNVLYNNFISDFILVNSNVSSSKCIQIIENEPFRRKTDIIKKICKNLCGINQYKKLNKLLKKYPSISTTSLLLRNCNKRLSTKTIDVLKNNGANIQEASGGAWDNLNYNLIHYIINHLTRYVEEYTYTDYRYLHQIDNKQNLPPSKKIKQSTSYLKKRISTEEERLISFIENRDTWLQYNMNRACKNNDIDTFNYIVFSRGWNNYNLMECLKIANTYNNTDILRHILKIECEKKYLCMY